MAPDRLGAASSSPPWRSYRHRPSQQAAEAAPGAAARQGQDAMISDVARHMPEVAEGLLGQPNQGLSSRSRVALRKPGSLAVESSRPMVRPRARQRRRRARFDRPRGTLRPRPGDGMAARERRGRRGGSGRPRPTASKAKLGRVVASTTTSTSTASCFPGRPVRRTKDSGSAGRIRPRGAAGAGRSRAFSRCPTACPPCSPPRRWWWSRARRMPTASWPPASSPPPTPAGAASGPRASAMVRRQGRSDPPRQ